MHLHARVCVRVVRVRADTLHHYAARQTQPKRSTCCYFVLVCLNSCKSSPSRSLARYVSELFSVLRVFMRVRVHASRVVQLIVGEQGVEAEHCAHCCFSCGGRFTITGQDQSAGARSATFWDEKILE